jgi:hypothetical protein
LVTEWRVKLLSLALTLSLLVPIALAQNQLLRKTISANVVYADLPAQVVLLSPPPSLTVEVQGMPGALRDAGPGAVTATVETGDLSHRPGTPPLRTVAQATLASHTPALDVVNSSVPVPLVVDSLRVGTLPVRVRTPNVAPGWTVTPESTTALDGGNQPARVMVMGAARDVDGLTAAVTVDSVIQGASLDIVSAPIHFFGPHDSPVHWPPRTIPPTRFAPTTVSVHVQATMSSAGSGRP